MRLSLLETNFWSSSNIPVSLLDSGWYKQQAENKITSKFLTDISFKRVSEEHDRQTNQRRSTKENMRTTSGCWHLKKHTVPTITSTRPHGWIKSNDLIDAGHYLNTLMCLVSQIQKCNIMSDKLSHYLSVWSKWMTFIRNVMTNCCTESVWHDAQRLMSCMADI